MKRAIEETDRRRKIQEEYNKTRSITPGAIKKEIRPSIVETKKEVKIARSGKEFLKDYIKELRFKMDLANRNLQFGEAIIIKNEIEKLKKLIRK